MTTRNSQHTEMLAGVARQVAASYRNDLEQHGAGSVRQFMLEESDANELDPSWDWRLDERYQS